MKKQKPIIPKEPIVPILNSQQITKLTNIVFGEEVEPEPCDAIFVFAGTHPGNWEKVFFSIENALKTILGDLILSVEHVGSTSVKGLGAKPILDIDVVIENYRVLPVVIKGLEKIGYYHQENWSFEGREAFGRNDKRVPWDGKNTNWMEHHLYVCNKDSAELARHLIFRNYLRNNPEAVTEYEQLKLYLARTAKDRITYTKGKTKFVHKILEKATCQIETMHLNGGLS